MKTNSMVALVTDFGKVQAGECGHVVRLFADTAEVKFDTGVKVVVPLVNLDEFEEAIIMPTTEKAIVQGNGNPDPMAKVEMLVAMALDSDAIESDRRALAAKIDRLNASIAALTQESRELSKVAPRALSAARRVSRMKLSDAAKVAEIRAACGEYAKKP